MDKLRTNALIRIDILKPEGWILDISTGQATLTYNQDLTVRLVTSSMAVKDKTVRSLHTTTIPPKSKRLVEVRTEQDAVRLYDCMFVP